MNLNTIKYFREKPGRFVGSLGSRGLLNWLPDRAYLSLVFRLELGYWPDFDNPRSFNEKLNWLKLYDRKAEYTRMVDKYEARSYIAEKIGAEYLIPLVGGPWESFEEINFDALPEQFVLKTTHDSGGVVICRDKASFDMEAARRKLTWHLNREYFWGKREWPYKDVKPRIIAEKYMQDGDNQALMDLKFFCFNGEPKFMYMSRDRAENASTDFFDMQFRRLDMRMKDPNSEIVPQKPENFEKLCELARVLAAGLPHVRVDFYHVGNETYSGEITFYHNGGFTHIYPTDWEKILGDWIELPKKMK